MAKKLGITGRTPLSQVIAASAAVALRLVRSGPSAGRRRVAYLSLWAGLAVLGLLPEAARGQESGSISVGASGSFLSSNVSERIANGVSAATIQVELRDSLGLTVEVDNVEVTFSTTVGELSSATALTENGVASVTLTSEVAGVASVSAEITSPEVGAVTNGLPLEVTFTPQVVDADQVIMAVMPATVIANGVSRATIAMKLHDADGAAVVGLEEDDFEFDWEGSAVIGGFAYAGHGIYSFSVTNTVPEITKISVVVDGVDLQGFDWITFTAPVPYTWIMARSPGSLPADGVSQATISMKLFDADRVGILGLEEEDFAFADFGSGVISGFREVGMGIYSFTVTNTVPEILNIRAEAGGVDLGGFDAISFIIPVVVTTEALPDWTVSAPNYPGALAAAGGTLPYTWSAVESGDLPTGLSVNPNGTFSGTPSAAGLFDFVVRVTDAIGSTATKPLSIRIFPAPEILTDANFPVGVVDLPYGPEWIEVTGGAAPVTFTVSGGGLPPGIALNPTSGQVSGTPTLTGTFVFEVTVTDAIGATATGQFTLVIVDPLRVTTTTLPVWTVDVPNYPGSLSAAGGTQPYSWTAVDEGDLPPGLVVNENGTFGGIPTVTGIFPFAVRVTDANGFTATATLSIEIFPVITSVSDLRLTVEANAAGASLGEEVVVVVRATNHGTAAANDVIVLEDHIAHAESLVNRVTEHRLHRISLEVDRGTVNSETGEWLIGRLEAKSAATMTVRLIVVEP